MSLITVGASPCALHKSHDETGDHVALPFAVTAMRLLPAIRAAAAIAAALVNLAAATPEPNAVPTSTTTRRDNSGFVTVVGDQFFIDGRPFRFIGTDAYWLPMFTDIAAVRTTLTTIKSLGLSVVRLW
jgi:hypothetical protein